MLTWLATKEDMLTWIATRKDMLTWIDPKADFAHLDVRYKGPCLHEYLLEMSILTYMLTWIAVDKMPILNWIIANRYMFTWKANKDDYAHLDSSYQ